MKNKNNIGLLNFQTQQKAYEYSKNIIYDLGPCEIDNSHEYFNFFVDLINNHSEVNEKKGIGISTFIIKKDNYSGDFLTMYLKRLDDSIIDFSWTHCSKRTKKTYKMLMAGAMRSAVTDYILLFLQSQKKKICKLCNNSDTATKYHVDHSYPCFSLLAKDFINSYDGLIPDKFDDNHKKHMSIFLEKDYDFEIKWKEYHNLNCNLQILCKTCNLKKGIH